MKMKKVLVLTTAGLVLSCSISVGASAVTIPSYADLIKIVVNQYENGTNPTGVFSGVNKDTKIGSILSDDVLSEIDVQLSSHKSVDDLITKIKNNKNNTVAAVLDKATQDEATFTGFKSKFLEIAKKVQAMDSKVGADRIAAEQKVVDITKAYDKSLDVTFGKDNQGKTTASITKDGNVVIQLNSDNLKTIIDMVNSITWNDVTAAKILLK
jgi:hypothetical protein